MPVSLKDFLGSRCPCCSKDILQQAPSTNRMPGADLAWCPSCDARLSLDELVRGPKRTGGSLLGRLFGKPQRG